MIVHYIVLYYVISYYMILYNFSLYYIILYYIMLYYIILYHIRSYDSVIYGHNLGFETPSPIPESRETRAQHRFTHNTNAGARNCKRRSHSRQPFKPVARNHEPRISVRTQTLSPFSRQTKPLKTWIPTEPCKAMKSPTGPCSIAPD